MNGSLAQVKVIFLSLTGVGPESHNAVYGFGPYYNLGCWEDKPGGGRTMTLLVNYRGKIDWSDMEKIGMYLVMNNLVFRFSLLAILPTRREYLS